jgi:predicted phage-related endonuclease
MLKVGELVTPTGRLILPAGELGSEHWLEYRRHRFHTIGPYSLNYNIGASDVPSILDLPGVGTPAHVFRNKVYDVREPVNEAMRAGNMFEHVIAMEWCARNRAVIDEIGLVAREGMPWRQCTIDRRVRECPLFKASGKECGLEVKYVEYVYEPRWRTDNGLPDRVTAQVIDQLLTTGFDHMHVACKVPGDFKMTTIFREREQELMEYVDGEVERFRNEHLVRGIEPPWNLDKADKMIALDNATYPERVGELDIETIGEVQEYAELAAEAGELDKRKKASSARLREIARGAQLLTFAGERAFWYGEGHRKNTNLERLAERWPEAYADCVTETTYPILNIDKAYKPKRGGKK